MMLLEQISQTDYHVEVIESLGDLQAITPEWQSFLENEVNGRNFFNDPVYISARLELEPQLEPWIIVLRRGGQICCIAPFYLHACHLKIEFSVIKLASLPIRRLTAFGGQFIVADDEDATHCFEIVFDLLSSQQSRFDLIYLENVPDTSPLWQYYRTASSSNSRFRFYLASSRIDIVHQIRFASTYDEFLKTLSYETRRKVRRYTRRLQNTAQVRLERIEQPDDVSHFLNQLDQIYRDTWQARVNGYTPRNTSECIRFFSQISRAGFLRSYVLANDGGPIAFALGYQYFGVYYFLETGYAQSWATFAPGIVLMHLFFEDLSLHETPDLLDFICGNQTYKQSFSNCRHGAGSFYVTLSKRWQLVLKMQQLLHFISRQVVRTLSFLRLERPFRKFFVVHH
jgi:CelD/BcsL family acetyltransferase involved in cellulose biosynthesis